PPGLGESDAGHLRPRRNECEVQSSEGWTRAPATRVPSRELPARRRTLSERMAAAPDARGGNARPEGSRETSEGGGYTDEITRSLSPSGPALANLAQRTSRALMRSMRSSA